MDDQSSPRSQPTAEKFVASLAEILDLPVYQRKSEYQSRSSEPAFGEYAEFLRGFAADEKGFARASEAEELIDAIAERSGLRLSGSGGARGFALMRELGLWGEHEILAVHRFGLQLDHDPAMVAEAEKLVEAGWSREEREDFTGWWTCSIDDADTRDIDDALSVRPRLEGGWELAVHIADPSAYVKPGTDLDAYVQRRGSSLYLPTGTHSMFPPILSEQAMSLVERLERPALTLQVTFAEDLEVEQFQICESVVRVDARLTYDEADALLAGEPRDSHAANVLAELRYIADELHARRHAAGAIDIDLPERRVKVVLEDDEPEISVELLTRTGARGLIMEMMVLVGGLVARFCQERGVPGIYRGQVSPDVVRSDSQIQVIPEGWAREHSLLRKMRRGEVSTSPAPHAALGINMYSQATSPIRRYSDLAVQRQVKATIRGEEPPYDEQALLIIAHTVEQAGYHCTVAQREAEKYWTLQHLARREGEEVDAIVIAPANQWDSTADVVLVDTGLRSRVRLRNKTAAGDLVTLRVESVRPRAGILSLSPT